MGKTEFKLDPRNPTGRKGKNKIQWLSRLRASKDVATAEDWRPTVNGLMHVKLFEYNPARYSKDGERMWRVHVSGDDDAFMELDLYDERRARHIFKSITHLTTKEELRALGLRRTA